MVKRTQKERSDTTQKKLIAVSRKLFGCNGFTNTSVEDVVQHAEVTRGALYHHYPGKEALFMAVTEQIENELMQDVLKIDLKSGWRTISKGLGVFLDRCVDQEFRQIILLDGPAVLGLERWHDIDKRFGGAQLKSVIDHYTGESELAQMYAAMVTNVFIGGLIEAAKSISAAEDPQQARVVAGRIIDRLIKIFQPDE
jgi:AcrR family transcriptional regulator